MNLHWITPAAAQAKISQAVTAAKAATTPVVFAYDDSSEGLDRPDLSLPGYQDELIDAVAAANPRTVVVLNTGSAVKMPWLAKTAAVLEMWYPGQKGAEATTAPLYGDVNPQGKLTQTFPVDEAHTLVSGGAGVYPGQDGQVKYTEGVTSATAGTPATRRPRCSRSASGFRTRRSPTAVSRRRTLPTAASTSRWRCATRAPARARKWPRCSRPEPGGDGPPAVDGTGRVRESDPDGGCSAR